jgi:hypothetical protein
MRSSSLATHALPRLVQPAAYGLKLITTPGRGTGIEAARRTISSASTLQQIPCSSLQLGVAVQSDHFETANPAETIYRVRNCAGVHASSAGLLEQLRSVNTWARGKKMSGKTVRLQVIEGVEVYVPPAVSFTDTETPGEVSVRTFSARS